MGDPCQSEMDLNDELRIPYDDPLNYLRHVSVKWEGLKHNIFNSLCSKSKTELHGERRTAADREEIASKWDKLSTYQINLGQYSPVYAPKDLLNALLSLKEPMEQDKLGSQSKWDCLTITLPAKNIAELRVHFSELLMDDDDNPESPCQQELKKGVISPSSRGEIWSLLLGSQLEPHHVEHWECLRLSVLTNGSLVDQLILHDVQLTASCDENYFVFADLLCQVMLCFSRDTEIRKLILLEDGHSSKEHESPLCGLVPFHGICMLAAPFCYLYENPVSLYYTFRAFYIRYCHQLTTINAHPQGIVSLCLLFEKLLQMHDPPLWSHLCDLQVQPISVVFKWLMSAFSGYLPPEELLVLWDLILSYDNVEILALFANIILSFRRESLMQVSSLQDIRAILSDLSAVKVWPLLQLVLSRN